MGAIPPIHGLGEEPHLPVIPVKPMSVAQSANVTPSALTVGDKHIDAVQLKQNPKYVNQVLDWILYRARTSFYTFRYPEAEYYYGEFFKYLKYYRANNIYGAPINFVPALFEFSWTREIEGKRKDAEHFFNVELLKLLEPTPAAPQPAAFSERVEQLIQQGQLPSPQHLGQTPNPEALNELAQLARQVQQPVLATRLLGFGQVLNLWSVFRAQNLAVHLDNESSSGIQQLFRVPLPMEHTGTPVAPVLPQPPDMMERVSSKKLESPEFHVDKVEPVYALEKDPREQENKRRKQRRALSKRKKPGTPEITL